MFLKMEPGIFAVPLFIGVFYLSGEIESQNISSQNSTSGKETDKGNRTHFNPYEHYHTLEMIRAQVLKKTTLNTVCKPKTPAQGDEIIITDMTIGSRPGPENSNFNFIKIGNDQTMDDQNEILDSATVSTINECIGRCTAHKKCLAYAYEDKTKNCKLTQTCTPNLTVSPDSIVYSMSYWYQM